MHDGIRAFSFKFHCMFYMVDSHHNRELQNGFSMSSLVFLNIW